MDKSLELLTPHEKSYSPVKKTEAELKVESVKHAKVFKTLEEAFAAFDSDDGPAQVPYHILEVPLPPVPNKEDVQNQLLQNALLLIDSGEYALSRNILEEILKKNPDSPEVVRWLGWCYKQEKKFDQAQDYYEQLSLMRTFDQDLFELGEIYYAKKMDQESILAWQRALSSCTAESPPLFDLHKNLGNAFTRLGDFESAEENYNKALTLRPNCDTLQVNFGTLALQKQSHLQDMAYFKRALEINPFNDRAWTGIALVAHEMRDFEWARATLLKAIEINPDNVPAQELLKSWEHESNGN